jgi:hypothetical protein
MRLRLLLVGAAAYFPTDSTSMAAAKSGRAERMLIAGDTKQGAKAWNEDSHCMFVSRNQRIIASGIFDGHGGFNGLLASIHCRDMMLALLRDNDPAIEDWSPADWETRLRGFFTEMHTTLRAELVNPKPDTTGKAPVSIRQPRFADDKGVVRTTNGDPVHGGTTGKILVVLSG